MDDIFVTRNIFRTIFIFSTFPLYLLLPLKTSSVKQVKRAKNEDFDLEIKNVF